MGAGFLERVLEGMALLADGLAFEIPVGPDTLWLPPSPVHSQVTVVPDDTATAAGPNASPSPAPTSTVTESEPVMSTVCS